jgi:uncharacterized protein (UPF0335 family)
MNKLKEEFLELLEKDKEFRYTVAGYLGLSEILKRLDRLEEGQNKLFESQKRIWENIEKLWENQNRLWENQNKLWEEVRELRKNYEKLESRFNGLEKSLLSIGKAVGVTLDHYTAVFLEDILKNMNIQKEKINIRVNVILSYKDKLREINIFNRDPLIVGEVTTHLENIEKAKEEIEKLIDDIKFVEEMFNKKIFMAILGVAVAPKEVIDFLKEECEKFKIKLFHGLVSFP